mgnify:CR=1 FL=1
MKVQEKSASRFTRDQNCIFSSYPKLFVSGDVKKGHWKGQGCIPFATVEVSITDAESGSVSSAVATADSGASSGLSVNKTENELPVAMIVIISVLFLAIVSCGTVYWVFIRHMRAVTKQLKNESRKKKKAFRGAHDAGKTKSVNLEDILAQMDIDPDEEIDYENMEQVRKIIIFSSNRDEIILC